MLTLQEVSKPLPIVCATGVNLPAFASNPIELYITSSPVVFGSHTISVFEHLYGDAPSPKVPPLESDDSRSLISDVFHLFRDFDFDKNRPISGENSVSHSSLRGEIAVNVNLGTLMPVTAIGSIKSNPTSYLYDTLPIGVTDFISQDLDALEQHVRTNANQSGVFTQVLPWGTYWPTRIISRRTDSEWEILYTHFLKILTGGVWTGTYYYVSRMYATLSIDSLEYVDGTFDVDDYFNVDFHLQVFHDYVGGQAGEASFSGIRSELFKFSSEKFITSGFDSDGYHSQVLQPYLISEMRSVRSFIGLTNEGHFRRGGVIDTDFTFRRFTDVVSNLTPDAFALAGLASNSALDRHIASFGVNQIENAQGLRALFGLVDVVKLFQDAHKLLSVKGILSGDLLLQSLDLLTNARLVYSYALSPTARDIKTIVSKASEFKHRWVDEGDFTTAPCYGDADIELPQSLTYPFDGVTCKLRVKIVGKFLTDGLLPYLMPIDAVGVLPRMSRLWAILPFSFVFDNILDVSTGLEVVESSVSWMTCYNVSHSVVSLLFEWSPSQTEFESLTNFTPENFLLYDFSYRSYIRYPISRIPLVGPSRLGKDLLTAHVPGDYLTYGSLAYQVAR